MTFGQLKEGDTFIRDDDADKYIKIPTVLYRIDDPVNAVCIHSCEDYGGILYEFSDDMIVSHVNWEYV